MKIPALLCCALISVVSASTKLQCDFYMSRGQAHKTVEQVYYCAATGLRVDSPATEIDGVEGIHLSPNSNFDVKMVYMYSSPDMLYMPSGIENFFGNLERLGISNTGLIAIKQSDLRPFPNLVIFYLSGNKLTSLDSGLFQFNPLLKYIDCDGNQLKSIATDIFDPIKDLEAVKFNGNVCISKEGRNREGVEVVKREIVDLCQNKIVHSTTSLPAPETTEIIKAETEKHFESSDEGQLLTLITKLFKEVAEVKETLSKIQASASEQHTELKNTVEKLQSYFNEFRNVSS